MSQQSVTFLSQPSNELHKPAKPIGGTARFKPGVAGNLTLKSAANDRQSETVSFQFGFSDMIRCLPVDANVHAAQFMEVLHHTYPKI